MDGQVASSRKARARQLRREGQSLRDIASRLSLSKTTVGRWLKGYIPGQQGRDGVKVRLQARDKVSHVKRTALVHGQSKTYAGQRDRGCPTGQLKGQQKRRTFPGWVCLILIVGSLAFFLFQMWLRTLDKPKPEPETGKSEGFDGRPFKNLAPYDLQPKPP